jgi:glutamate formiminotransferase
VATSRLECVINISAGQPEIGPIAAAGGVSVRDLHSDPDHNRSVLTVIGTDIWDAVTAVTEEAVARLDLATHTGVHPRIGVVDVVPFVDLDDPSVVTPRSLTLRNRFAAWATDSGVPCLVYGPERSLPEVRRLVRDGLGPPPHPTAGVIAVGARPVLVAYNLWLASSSLEEARRIAAAIRRAGLRTLGLQVGAATQVSCNLTEPLVLGPADAYDLVAKHATIARAELVGLLPEAVLGKMPPARWNELDVGPDRTIEARVD